MNLDEVVTRGRLAWEPSSEATAMDAWHYNDVPDLGTFKLGDVTVLFFAVTGVDVGRSSVWAYVPLPDGLAEELAVIEHESVVEMFDQAQELFHDREVVFAWATDFTVREWSRQDVTDSVMSAASSFLDDLAVALERNVPRGQRRRAEVRRQQRRAHSHMDASMHTVDELAELAH